MSAALSVARAATSTEEAREFEFEQALLGALLQDGCAALASLDLDLRDVDFLDPRHRHLFRAILSLREAGSEIDPILVANKLETTGKLALAGDRDYIGSLIGIAPPSNAPWYAREVLEAAQRRALVEYLERATNDARAGRVSAADVAAELQTAAERLTVARPDSLPDATCAATAPAYAPVSAAIEGIANKSEPLLVVGDSGGFKSALTIHMACAMAGGYAVCNRFATQQAPVLIVSAEDSAAIVQMRCEAFVRGHGWDQDRVLGNVHYFAHDDITLSDRRWQLKLLAEVKRLRAGMVVLDPLAELLVGDENSNTDLRPVIKYIRAIASLGAVPIVVHHAGKASADRRQIDRIRGASAIASAARSILFVEFGPAGVRIEHLKMSRAPRVDPFMLQRHIETDPANRAVWTSARLEYADPKVVQLTRAQEFVFAQVAASPRQLTTRALRTEGNRVGFGNDDVSRALKALTDLGRIASVSGPRNSVLWFPTNGRSASAPNGNGVSLGALESEPKIECAERAGVCLSAPSASVPSYIRHTRSPGDVPPLDDSQATGWDA